MSARTALSVAGALVFACAVLWTGTATRDTRSTIAVGASIYASTEDLCQGTSHARDASGGQAVVIVGEHVVNCPHAVSPAQHVAEVEMSLDGRRARGFMERYFIATAPILHARDVLWFALAIFAFVAAFLLGSSSRKAAGAREGHDGRYPIPGTPRLQDRIVPYGVFFLWLVALPVTLRGPMFVGGFSLHNLAVAAASILAIAWLAKAMSVLKDERERLAPLPLA